MKVGIFGGSFDPVHNGHIRLAQYVLDHTGLDEVWLMVSPLNPLKPQGYVASDTDRLAMARLAVEGHPGLRVSDFEFSLSIPSYTYNTLTKLKEAYPDHEFRLIIGGDNWAHFDSWRDPQEILEEFDLIVYPRPGEEILAPPEGVTILRDAPEMEVSSTQIRRMLASGPFDSSLFPHDSLTSFLPKPVLDYILSHLLYRGEAKTESVIDSKLGR